MGIYYAHFFMLSYIVHTCMFQYKDENNKNTTCRYCRTLSAYKFEADIYLLYTYSDGFSPHLAMCDYLQAIVYCNAWLIGYDYFNDMA